MLLICLASFSNTLSNSSTSSHADFELTSTISTASTIRVVSRKRIRTRRYETREPSQGTGKTARIPWSPLPLISEPRAVMSARRSAVAARRRRCERRHSSKLSFELESPVPALLTPPVARGLLASFSPAAPWGYVGARHLVHDRR